MTVRAPAPEVRRRRDARATRSSILDAAEAIFVERGFAATSMSEIAELAGVTKSLIHHHFGSKRSLWQEVKRHRLEAYSGTQKAFLDSSDVSLESFATSIRRYFRFLAENPGYVRLTSWVFLEEPGLAAPADPELLEKAIARIREGQRRGTIRKDLAPRHVLASFISLCSHWFIGRETYRHYGKDPAGAPDDEAYLDDMLKIFFDGVRPR